MDINGVYFLSRFYVIAVFLFRVVALIHFFLPPSFPIFWRFNCRIIVYVFDSALLDPSLLLFSLFSSNVLSEAFLSIALVSTAAVDITLIRKITRMCRASLDGLQGLHSLGVLR